MARSKLHAVVRVATLVASIGAPGLAFAADLLPPPPPPPLPPPVDFAGGWYLRGDVGASIYTAPKYAVNDIPGTHFFGEAQSGGLFAGVGVGYQFNNFFRADVTGEYRTASLRLSSYNDFGSGCGCDPTGRNFNLTSGHYDAAVVLANGYFDLGTWYGITPFVGGGVGAAFNYFSGFTDSGVTNFYAPYVYNQPTSPGVFKSKTTESFAWALHAGLAYDVTPNFKVELAYRYLNLGHAQTGVLTCLDASAPACTTVLKAKNLEAHDIKLGVRYLIGSAFVPALPPLMPEPLVRKY
ncbi:outer membrane protein [Methylobacterium sp. J-067]|uniref:outer membrane protein n=1 Tax=Methylobacterium sp. J-067 TaxID=2836648 RepID=UPI001FBBE62F|nr:outer membrane beta-barrel protein [Methylobacterium sp. J-067]MCJ2025505.1 outer membrane beta-barrel protein [Methylobacterium sp. J-067]